VSTGIYNLSILLYNIFSQKVTKLFHFSDFISYVRLYMVI